MAYTGLAGLSSLGVKLGYGTNLASTKPSSFTQLNRINSIGGISITPETIDASAMEDLVEKSIAGRGSTGGQWTVTVNVTDDTMDEWATLISTYQGLTGGNQVWFEVLHPDMTDAFFVIAQPPQELPMPEMGANELLTMEIQLTIVEYKGLSTKVTLT